MALVKGAAGGGISGHDASAGLARWKRIENLVATAILAALAAAVPGFLAMAALRGLQPF